jgi:hypothetical protein
VPKNGADDVVCAGCGKPIGKYRSPRYPGDRAVEVRVGKLLQSQVVNGKRKPGRPRLESEKFRADSIWGVMHLGCFVRSLESPDDVFAELRVQADAR